MEEDSRAIFATRSEHNAFSGIVDVRSGEITLYPLEETRFRIDEGYGNTTWKGEATYRGGKLPDDWMT